MPPTPIPSINMSGPQGYIQFGPVGWSNNYYATESYTVLDNLTKVLGRHTLRTGFVYRLSHAATFQSAPTYVDFSGAGTVNPNTGVGEGGGLAEFMQGALMNNGNGTAFTSWQPYIRYRYWGFYLQDDFRINPKLTLNIGLRYDIYGAYKTRQHPDSRFCYGCYNSYTGLQGVVQYEGEPGFPMNSDIFSPNWNDLGPRFNFSYSPFADRKTVIRGGYDIFYSNSYSAVNGAQTMDNAVGYVDADTWEGSINPTQCAPRSGQCVAWSLDDTTTNKATLSTPPFSTTTLAAQKNPLYTLALGQILKPARDPMVQTWTLDVQRQLPGDMVLSVAYVGSHGTHLVGDSSQELDRVSTANLLKYRQSINAVVPITSIYSGQTAQALEAIWGTNSLPLYDLLDRYPAFSGANTKQTFNGASIYHALQVRLDKRYSHGLNLNVAYTASKNIANAYTGEQFYMVIDPVAFSRTGDVGGRTGALKNQADGGDGIAQDPDNAKADRAIAYNDIPQMVNVALTYRLPFGSGRNFLNRKGLLNHLVGGWNLTGSFNAESGVPLHISGPCNAMTCRPNLVGDPKAVPGGQNANDWINAAAFTPPFGTDQTFWVNPDPNDNRWWQFGNAGPRLPGLRSPGFWNLDSALGKKFNISESKYIDFRWEMFNALNHQNLGLPDRNYCLPPNADGSTDLVHQSGCSFGRITNIQTDPRAMEFALKFYW